MLQQLPFPFMQRPQEQNHIGAVSELRTVPKNMGHNAQGRSQDVVEPLPHQPRALQSPHRTSPNHQDKPKAPQYPQIMRVCEQPRRNLALP